MIPAVVLAAGLSERMGTPKAALPLPGGATFLSRVLETLAAGGASQLVVVMGHHAQAVRDAASTARLRVPLVFVANPDPARGQLSSLVCGLDAVPASAAAALVTLADVPLPLASTVRALVERWAERHPPLVRPVRRGRHGHPFVAGRPVLDAIRRAPLSLTTRDVLSPWLPGEEVDVLEDGPFEDVDTPEDYERLLEKLTGV